MNHKVSLGLTISIAALACAVTFILTSFFSLQGFNSQVQDVKEKAEKYDRLEALDTYVHENYYTRIDEDAAMDGLLKGYVAGLGDRYSSYMTPEEYASLQQKESGRSVGIGISVQEDAETGVPVILLVEDNSPAAEAGLAVDDRIVGVEGEDAASLGYEETVTRIRGEENTSVTLQILRGEEELSFTITRRTFEVTTVYSKMLDNGVGYIRITNFRENTVEQFQDALDTLTANGAKGLLFDVRSNGGGLLDSLEKMVDPLLPEGVIATATYQEGNTETVVYSDASELDLPMVVLINENSASAAELFAASLRDFKGAKLVGKQSFGKGVMQVTSRLDDGGGLTLTVATYQTARSECYDGVGLVPDVEVEAGEDTRIADGDPLTDPQLAAAMQLFE
ncbi:MAG: S41 family peptidase [Oscillospiraceae bacterium]|nr:S41 family peptidase [Oscillospiraceae bacterium]